jgi:RNA polymerase sigma-70 factor (ECF subfamily)
VEKLKNLINHARQGNQDAFAELVAFYEDKVYGLSYSLTKNQVDAQDLAQEVFLQAYLAIRNFRGEADFGTWLHRITVNLWLNNHHKKKIKPVFNLDAPLETEEGKMLRLLPDSNDGPEEITVQKEFQRQVKAELKNLPPAQQTVLILREVEGYSYIEIAQILNCSVGTVRSRLNRARQCLQKKLRDLANNEGERGK